MSILHFHFSNIFVSTAHEVDIESRKDAKFLKSKVYFVHENLIIIMKSNSLKDSKSLPQYITLVLNAIVGLPLTLNLT